MCRMGYLRFAPPPFEKSMSYCLFICTNVGALTTLFRVLYLCKFELTVFGIFVEWQTNRQRHARTERETDRQTCYYRQSHTDRVGERDKDRQSDRRAKTDRQTHKNTHTDGRTECSVACCVNVCQADLIHLGAKYSPCMRRDENVMDAILQDRQKENQTGCCVRNDGSGCVQSLQEDCSVSSTL